VLETVLFRGLFDRAAGQAPALLARLLGRAPAGRDLLGSLTGVWGAVLILVAGLLAVELPAALSLRAAGRRLERRMRGAFARKIPRLGDRYFQTRPISDMAERAHVAHHLRALPALGGQIVRAVAEVMVTATALAWLYPAGAVLAAVLAAAMLLLPLTAQTALTERDLRMRNHAGALARFYLDALLGLVAVRTHRAEDAMVSEHHDRLREWLAASGATLRAALTTEVIQSTIGFGLAAWLLAGFVSSGSALRGGAGAALLVIYWSLSLPALGSEIGFLVRQYPQQRNVTLRLMEPLGAPEDEVGAAAPVAPPASPPIAELATKAPVPIADRPPATGARVQVSDLEVRAAGHTILTVGGLTIAPGEQIAIVGPSGAGKSTLLALLLGWHRPSAGTLLVDGQPLLADALERLRRDTVWVDPAVYLWNRSLHANLAFGLNAAPPSLAAVIDEAELGDIVRRLPGGVQGSLGEAGALVSGGEGQRVRFARGLCREPPRLVVLDEPFRGLTREQRHRLLARARERWAGATLLCVTHDIGETLVFPRVLVVADGRLLEDGAPEVLAARSGTRYAALLDAEERVRRLAWSPTSATAWRRLRMVGGRVAAASEVGP
jgi:ABC-type bacteriocin/lantibiotic exporter with double-glycine peptidase domain